MHTATSIEKNPELYWDMLKCPRETLAGCQIVYTGIKSPWLNGVVSGIASNPSSIVEYFNERDTPFCWWSECDTEPESLAEVLEQQGMISLGEFVGMQIDSSSFVNRASTRDVKVELVSSDASLAKFLKVLMEVYEANESIFPSTYKVFSNAGLKHPVYHFVAKVEDAIVSIGSIYVDEHDVASVYNMGTLVQHRKKGYASALLQGMLEHLFKEKATSSALIATPDGVNFYRHLGYDGHKKFHLYMLL